MAFCNETHNNSQIGGGGRLNLLYRATAVTFVLTGKGERGIRGLKYEIQVSPYALNFFFSLFLFPSFLFGPMLTSLQLSGGPLYFEHTASRARENEDRGGTEKAAERREINRIIPLSERHEDRKEQAREDRRQGEKRGRRGCFTMNGHMSKTP